MAETKSFLAGVKDEINEAFATQYDTLAEISTDQDRLAESLKTTQRSVWEIVERRLKESFQNGKKTVEKNDKKPNPFRK